MIHKLKDCTKCGKTKHTNSFYNGKSACKLCCRKYQRAYVEKNRDKIKEKRLMNQYGIDLMIYNQMLKNQNRCCKICNRRVDLVVDHNHKTGDVRGLLCGSCNKALGLLQDNKQVIRNMYNYL
tara:strand:- start:1573 stop:1941 length:369 start_codon:yes stop_codon:yes gene_type:complete